MPTTILFPPEVFVDHLLVTIRDSGLHLPGSSVPYRDHARQAAALAGAEAHPPSLVAAALLYGIGDVLVSSWARHPAAPDDPWAPTEAAAAHLGAHLEPEVIAPISLLPQARAYLAANEGLPAMSAPRRRRFEQTPHAWAAVALAVIDRHAGNGPMLTPPLASYRDLLFDLCTDTLAVEPAGSQPVPRSARTHIA